MWRGSFDEQNLKSSESWLGRYYGSVLPSRVPGKKMWKKGRGTTKWKLGDVETVVDAEYGPFDKLRAGSAEETHVACRGYCTDVLGSPGEGERRMQFSNYCGLIKLARCGFPFLTSGRLMTSPVISFNREGGP